MDMIEDIRTLSNMANDAAKWKADNGRTSPNNPPPRDAPPPPLGQAGNEVNINVDDEAFI